MIPRSGTGANMVAKLNTPKGWRQRLKSVLLGVVLGLLIPSLAFGQAVLLPNAVQQYFNANGMTVANGTVTYYQPPGTTTLGNVWQDAGQTTLETNPVLLNAAGEPQPAGQTYGVGCYQQVVKDVNNVQIWSAVTCSTGGSGGGSGGGVFTAGIPIGAIIPWASTALPSNYLYTAGQAVSRTTYNLLLTALTFQQSIVCQSGVPTITVPTAVTDITPIGAPIEASCFAPGTTVLSKVSGTLTMTNNATTTATVSSVIYPWGNGDGSTTFNVPDMRGRVAPGRDNMTSSIAGTLNSTYYQNAGVGVNPDAINAIGGSQSTTLAATNVPALSASGTGAGTGTASVTGNFLGSIPYTPGNISTFTTGAAGGSGNGPGGSNNWFNAGTSLSSTGTVSTTVSVNTTTSGTNDTPFSRVPPSVTTDYVIKALPDTTSGGLTGAINGVLYNASGAPGVTGAGLTGQILLGVTGGAPVWGTMSGDGTITNTGVLTVTKTNGVAFAPSATIDTTNAANITVGVLPLAHGGTGQTSAQLARALGGLNIDELTATGDANYPIAATDRAVYHTALTAARTDTLPAANSVNPGQRFYALDMAGVSTASNTITLQRAGTDSVNGGTTFVAIAVSYGVAQCTSDGVSRWTCAQIAGGTGGGGVTGVTIAAGAGVAVSGTCNITSTGTCTVSTSAASGGSFGGRLTLISGVPYINVDTVGAQNVYYAPCAGCGGNAVPIFNGSALQSYQFTSSPTDQVGLTLALGGSANWAANTIFDVFVTLNGGVPVLATRAWDSSMLPSAPAQVANNVAITSRTGGTAWSNVANAFNGTTSQSAPTNTATLAPSNNSNGNCIGQDFGAGNPQAISQIIINGPNNANLRNDTLTYLPTYTWASNDNTNWTLTDERSLDSSGIGTVYTLGINASDTTPYRYWETCIAGNGSANIYVAQMRFYTTAGPATRRLTAYNGILVNDAVMTGRISSSSTISVPQYQATYLGSFQTDSGTAGQVTAYVNAGPSRVYNIWNSRNQASVSLRAFVPWTITGLTGNSYSVTSTSWTNIQASTAFSLSVLKGYADEPTNCGLTRNVYMNAASQGVGYSAAISVGNSVTPSGTVSSVVNDATGPQNGETLVSNLTLPPFFGSNTLYGIEFLAYPSSGTLSAFTDLVNTVLQCSWRG